MFRKTCFLFLVACFLFLLITPNITKPTNAYAGTMQPVADSDWSGQNVTFHWSPAVDISGVVLIITDQDDPLHPAVYNSADHSINLQGRSSLTVNTADWNIAVHPPDGRFRVVLVWIYAEVSNGVTFTIPVAGAAWTITDPPTWSGSDVTFNWNNPGNTATSLVIVDWDDPTHAVVWDSLAKGVSIDGLTSVTVNTSSWDIGPGVTLDGNFAATIVVWGTLQSNRVIFTIGGGKTWKDPGPPPPPFDIMDVFQPAKRFGSFGQLASDVLLILVSLAGALALIFIVISGFKFVTSSGDEKKLASARATLTYAIIGIAVVILAFVIVQILQYFLQSSIPIT